MGQTLKAAVHEASIAEVGKPHSALHAVGGHRHIHFFIQFFFLGKGAVSEMVSLVFFLAHFCAIGNLLAPADEGQLLVLVATFAFGFIGTLEKPVAIMVNRLDDKVVSFLKL